MFLAIPARLNVNVRLQSGMLAVDVRGKWLVLGLRRFFTWEAPPDMERHLLRWLLVRDREGLALDSSRLERAREAVGVLVRLGRRGLPVLQHLFRRMRLEQVDIAVRIGARDTMQTALACGAGWVVLGQVAAALRARANLAPGAIRMSLVPNFQEEQFHTDITTRGWIRPLHLLQAGWIALRAGVLDALQDGLPRLRSAGASLR